MSLSRFDLKNPGRRGQFPAQFPQFYALSGSPDAPVLLDERVRWYLAQKAEAQGISVNELVNDLLKRAIVFSEKMG